MDGNDMGGGKCPVMHGSMTAVGRTVMDGGQMRSTSTSFTSTTKTNPSGLISTTARK
jgi:catalase-peroxidase